MHWVWHLSNPSYNCKRKTNDRKYDGGKYICPLTEISHYYLLLAKVIWIDLMGISLTLISMHTWSAESLNIFMLMVDFSLGATLDLGTCPFTSWDGELIEGSTYFSDEIPFGEGSKSGMNDEQNTDSHSSVMRPYPILFQVKYVWASLAYSGSGSYSLL